MPGSRAGFNRPTGDRPFALHLQVAEVNFPELGREVMPRNPLTQLLVQLIKRSSWESNRE